MINTSRKCSSGAHISGALVFRKYAPVLAAMPHESEIFFSLIIQNAYACYCSRTLVRSYHIVNPWCYRIANPKVEGVTIFYAKYLFLYQKIVLVALNKG